MPSVPSGFTCLRCGACCRWPGSVLLEEGGADAAAAELGLDVPTFIDRYAELARNRAQLTLREREDGACVLLDAGNRCRIYAARPKQCREFPAGWRVDGCPARAAVPPGG